MEYRKYRIKVIVQQSVDKGGPVQTGKRLSLLLTRQNFLRLLFSCCTAVVLIVEVNCLSYGLD